MARRSNNPQVGVTWDTVSLPISGGVDLRSNDRARPLAKLARLVNGTFEERNSVAKRTGHVARRVMMDVPFFVNDRPEEERWIYGVGSTDPVFSGDLPVSPAQRHLRGVVTRGDEVAAWTGDRLLSWNSGQRKWTGSCDFFEDNELNYGTGAALLAPSGPVTDLPGPSNVVSTQHNSLLGKSLRAQFWVVDGEAFGQLLSDDGGAVSPPVTLNQLLNSSGNPEDAGTVTGIQVLYMGGHFCAVLGNDADEVYLAHIPEATPSEDWQLEFVADFDNLNWDVCKFRDDRAIVAGVSLEGLKAVYVNRTGPVGEVFSLDYALHLPSGLTCAVSVAPGTEQIGMVWATAADAWQAVYTPDGDLLGSASLATEEITRRVAITSLSLVNATGGSTFVSYCHTASDDAGVGYEYVTAVQFTSVGEELRDTYYHCTIASRAFSVGQIPFVTLVTTDLDENQPKQSTYALVGGVKSKFVAGAWGRQAAAIFPGDNSSVPNEDLPRSVDFGPDQDAHNRTKWCLGFTHQPRYARGQQDNRDEKVQVENRGLRVELDFLPPLRFAEAGKSTYMAGAAVQQWDGERIHEAGFLLWPEYLGNPTVSNDDDGTMTVGDKQYRVYYCRRNRWGEVSRSAAVTTDIVTVSDTTSKVTVRVKSLTVTTDDRVYLEIYRSNGGAFKLISGFDASTAVQNDMSAAGMSYVDMASDESVESNPSDPSAPSLTSLPELEEVAPPGCEVIATIGQRVFFAGGIVPAGRVAYTKEFEPGETIGWNDQSILEQTLERDTRPVTALCALGEGVLAFRRDDAYVWGGPGPDNTGEGTFSAPVKVAIDRGADSQECVVVVPDGVMLFTQDGPRIVLESRQVAVAGDEVTPAARGRYPVAALLVPYASQVRFYLDNGVVLVYDYVTRFWSTHTGLRCRGAVMSRGYAVLARADGEVWFETPGVYLDGGLPYEYLWKTAEIRREELITGAHRFRRWAVNGDWRGSHELTVRIYYSGSPYVGYQRTWDPSTAVDNEPFGDTLWPDPTLYSGKDGVYRTRRRFDTRGTRAASVAFEVSDGYATGDSFVITELALELGLKDGLTRLPRRDFNG